MFDIEFMFSYECEYCNGVYIVDYSLFEFDVEISIFDVLFILECYLYIGGRKVFVKF